MDGILGQVGSRQLVPINRNILLTMSLRCNTILELGIELGYKRTEIGVKSVYSVSLVKLFISTKFVD